MPTDRPRRERGQGAVVIPLRPSTPTSDDLREYLPAKGSALEALDEARLEQDGEPDPALVAKLQRMNEAEAARASKPSSPGDSRVTSPKVKTRSDVVAEAPAIAPPSSPRALSTWKILMAVAAVVLPVVLTIVVMRAEVRSGFTAKPDANAVPSATPDVAIPGTQSVSATAGAQAHVPASASPSGTAVSTAAPLIQPRPQPRPKMSADAGAPPPPPPVPTVAPDILP